MEWKWENFQNALSPSRVAINNEGYEALKTKL